MRQVFNENSSKADNLCIEYWRRGQRNEREGEIVGEMERWRELKA